jgi:ankyrin repeat protein
VPRREIPVLPRRATPSNIRSKSSDVRHILFTNQAQTENKNHAISAYTRYERTKVRSTQPIGNSRNSAKSVDHIREYMVKKKEKENIFVFIKEHANIAEFERYIKSNNPDLNCRDENWMTPLHIAVHKNMGTAWISILVKYGADINRLTPSNKTALHFA